MVNANQSIVRTIYIIRVCKSKENLSFFFLPFFSTSLLAVYFKEITIRLAIINIILLPIYHHVLSTKGDGTTHQCDIQVYATTISDFTLAIWYHRLSFGRQDFGKWENTHLIVWTRIVSADSFFLFVLPSFISPSFLYQGFDEFMNVVMGEAEEVWIKKNIGKRRELGKIIQPTVYIEFWFIFAFNKH